MQRLRQRADFLAAAAGTKAFVIGFVLQALRRREDHLVRVGFTVSKKVGNAVERNRVRRRLREVVRLAPPERMRPGFDYVLIGRRAALDLPFGRLSEELGRALDRVHAGPPAAQASAGVGGRKARTRPNASPHAGTK